MALICDPAFADNKTGPLFSSSTTTASSTTAKKNQFNIAHFIDANTSDGRLLLYHRTGKSHEKNLYYYIQVLLIKKRGVRDSNSRPPA
jgi:hypothetical protein